MPILAFCLLYFSLNFDFVEDTPFRKNKEKGILMFSLNRTFAIKMAKLLHLGKKKNEFFCFALDFS